MKKQLLCGVAAVSLSLAYGAALAADMPVKAAPIYGCIWNGLYAGAHIGFAQPRFKGTFVGDSDPSDFKQGPLGFLGGGQVGQNWCNNTFVYGWEGDISFLSAKQRHLHVSDDDSLTNKMSLLASLRLRLGTTVDPQTMIYLAFGPAYAHGTATFFDEDVPTTIKSNFDKFGGVVAIGAEKALWGNWFSRIEAAYYFFNGKINFDDGSHSASDKLNGVLALQVGLSYKFGDAGKAQVAAMPTKAPAIFDWSGFYVGGGAGWQGSKIGLSSDPALGGTLTYKPTHDSFALGGHVGAQTQFDRLVVGIEGSYVSGFDQKEFRTPSISIFFPGGTGTTAAKFKDAWSVGGRAGWSMGSWMPYLAAGWAEGRFGFRADDGSIQTANSKNSGAYFGGGVDFALAHNWILGVEYRYYDFKAKNTTASDGEAIRFDPKTETVMARLSYKFGTGGTR